MFIEFAVSNFRSFKERQAISFVAGRDRAHPQNATRGDGVSLLRAALVFGANESGKSNLIRAIKFLIEFVQNANTISPEAPIPFLSPFALDEEHESQPSMFELSMLVDGIRYSYEVSADRSRVHTERLVAYPHGKKAVWIDRTLNKVGGSYSTVLRGPFEADGKLLTEKTRSNGLVLSRAADLNNTEAQRLFRWFSTRVLVIDLAEPTEDLVQMTARRLVKDELFLSRVLTFMRDASVGPDSVRISQEKRPEEIPAKLREVFSERGLALVQETWGSIPSLLTLHSNYAVGSAQRNRAFVFSEFESCGTQRFFSIAAPLLDFLELGGTLVLDELGSSMHPLLSRKLLEYWLRSSGKNPLSQLIAATHETVLFDGQLLRRDQIWMAEKHDHQTVLNSLYDFRERPRASAALQRSYLSGRFGGIGTFGSSFEDFETPGAPNGSQG